ncbi:hypothetical protein RvY_12074 [Ramazzottius varieornatus]|uniref:Alpha-1,4-N-acetylglucosaminyltransferase n=1 Tax=Ramazzottius varieornatus TaxID=947166 RepID=A0A1D1VI63_RAMVA|nr:hypothetical protein RvY_12074 [Ramazzottius varieornatus]
MAKLELLLEYGGVAVDFDVFFIQGERIKDILKRKKAITCYGDEDGNNIRFVAARKDSKFIWAWRKSYEDICVANDRNFNKAFVSKYLSVLYPEDVYVTDHIFNNPHPDRQLSQFFRDCGKIPWRNSIAIHSYERFGGVPISSFEDLQNANVTTHTIWLRTIHFNAKIPARSKDLKDEVIPPSPPS